MAGAELLRFSRWMQWIRKKKQAVNQLRIFRNKNGRLPSAIRMATQKYSTALPRPHERNCSPQTLAVPGCAAGPRWPGRALRAERQIKTQHGEAHSGESSGHFDQQFRLAVCAGAMCKHNHAAIRRRRLVQEAANGRICKIDKRREHRICKVEKKTKAEAVVGRKQSH